MSDPRYPFSDGDYLSVRPNYAYSDCSGNDFPALWLALRRATCARLATAAGPQPTPPARAATTGDAIGIDELLDRLAQPGTDAELDLMVQRFEAGKRLYDVYRGSDRRGDTATGFREMGRYVRFGELLAAAYRRRGVLPLLNALLKLCDLLGAHADDIPGAWRGRAAGVFELERSCVAELAHARGVPWPE